MSKRRDRQSGQKVRRESGTRPLPPTARSSAPFALGVLCLVAAAITSGVLVQEHFGARLPGCGEGSACARAAASFWGKVPGTSWPVSFVGLAYFTGLLGAWLVSFGRLSGVQRGGVAAGGVLSLFYVGVMIAGGYFCQYCVGVHAANLAFVAITLIAPAALPAAGHGPSWLLAGVFATVSVGLGYADIGYQRQQREQAEAARAAASADVTRAATQAAPSNGIAIDPPATTQPAAGRAAAGAASNATPTATTAANGGAGPTPPRGGGFTGRWRVGPDPAPIRIVMITGYQCPDCKQLEAQADTLLKTRSDISISIKHFPMCTACNPHVKRNMHPNGCWAARAAEAAGTLQGAEGFWRMHRWLFSQGGSFTDASLPDSLRELGFEPSEFIKIMSSPETLQRVQADIQDGIDLGLHYTPMIFVNGVELKGWNAPNALIRTVEEVAAKSPPARSFADDQPPYAAEKYVADWREQPTMTLPPDALPRRIGPDNAPVSIVVFGDYQEAGSALAHATIKGIMATRGDVQYSFRHYPFNQECNKHVPRSQHAFACRAALAAEAAAALGGPDAFWQMHDFLFSHQGELGEPLLARAAAELGLSADELTAKMAEAPTAAGLQDDVNGGPRVGLREIPTIIVNGKRIPRWQREGDNVLARIVNEAAATAPAAP